MCRAGGSPGHAVRSPPVTVWKVSEQSQREFDLAPVAEQFDIVKVLPKGRSKLGAAELELVVLADKWAADVLRCRHEPGAAWLQRSLTADDQSFRLLKVLDRLERDHDVELGLITEIVGIPVDPAQTIGPERVAV